MFTRLVLVSCLVALGLATEIHEAQTLVTFSRGFDDADLALRKYDHPQSMFHDIRQVVVQNSESFGSSFLQTSDEWTTDSSPVKKSSHPCTQCTPGSTHCKPCVDEVIMSAGPLHFHLVRDLQRRNLIRSVKWGTSAVPPWTTHHNSDRLPDEVHMHQVDFDGDAFTTRPIVLVTVLPVCDGNPNKCDPKWTDVYATSLSHISTVGFVVNIVRLDSLPNNTWGQQIHIAWVAFEPNDVKAMKHDLKTGAQDTHVTLHMGPGV